MKKLVSILVMCFVMFSLVACGEKAPAVTPPAETSAETPVAPAEKPVIGVAIFDYSNNYVTYIRNSIATLSEGKADIQMVDAQNDQAKQVEQIDTLLSKGVDVLCVNAVDPKAAATIISKAKAADVPIIFFNRSPSEADMNSYDKCWYVGTTPADSGKMQAEMAMEAFKADKAYDKNGDGVLNQRSQKDTLAAEKPWVPSESMHFQKFCQKSRTEQSSDPSSQMLIVKASTSIPWQPTLLLEKMSMKALQSSLTE